MKMKTNDAVIHGPELFTDPIQLIDLNIVDLQRPNGFWNSPGDALRTIFSWLDNSATFTIADIHDFDVAPKRDDFPNWSHVGRHQEVGEKLWNWFHWKFPNSLLQLHDSPDFSGRFYDPEIQGGCCWFCGDIGRVSASAFAISISRMNANQLWISVVNGGYRQIIIEPLADNGVVFLDQFLGD